MLSSFDPIEDFLEARLQKIIFNNTSVTVYRYGPNREKGQTIYPCVTFERMRFDIDYTRARPADFYFEASDELATVTLTKYQTRGGELTRTGPDFYYIKKYPIPINIYYYINAFATSRDHINYLQFALMQSFPPAYMPELEGQYPMFSLQELDYRDDMSIPLYDVGGVLSIEGIWIERLGKEEIAPSIKGFNWNMLDINETEEYV